MTFVDIFHMSSNISNPLIWNFPVLFSSLHSFSSLMIGDCPREIDKLDSFLFPKVPCFGSSELVNVGMSFPSPHGRIRYIQQFLSPFCHQFSKVFVLFSPDFYFTNAQKQHNQAKLNTYLGKTHEDFYLLSTFIRELHGRHFFAILFYAKHFSIDYTFPWCRNHLISREWRICSRYLNLTSRTASEIYKKKIIQNGGMHGMFHFPI